jgi:hypothetical protein
MGFVVTFVVAYESELFSHGEQGVGVGGLHHHAVVAEAVRVCGTAALLQLGRHRTKASGSTTQETKTRSSGPLREGLCYVITKAFCVCVCG